MTTPCWSPFATTLREISPRFAYIRMLRATSEMAAAMTVWSPVENPAPAASSRPCWRACTTSTSDAISTRSWSATLDASTVDASSVADQLRVEIASDVDVVQARQHGRELAAGAGFSTGDQTVIAAAISEVARNILMYAKRGEISLSVVANGDQQGVVIVARDQGPGIPDVSRALQDGYSTSGGLGLGLPGARRLMDDFDIASVVGQGTTVTMRKWRRLPS